MTAITDMTLINNKNSKQFLLRCVAPVQDKMSQPSIDIPFIAQVPKYRVIFRFTGQAEDVRFTFALFNDGVDVSNGTQAGGIYTVIQQIAYLKQYMYLPDFDCDWYLTSTKFFSDQPSNQVKGVIEDLSIEAPIGPGNIIPCSLYFKVGNIGDLG